MDVKKRILVVDDEETLCEVLRFNLEAEGYDVEVAHSSEEVLAMDVADTDLILLDIMMGEISGFQLAGILKSNPRTSSIPIIFCTAKDTEDNLVAGLDAGADDYIAKPFSLREVLARVRSVLRRTEAKVPYSGSRTVTDSDTVSYKGLVLNPDRKSCFVDGKEVKLPRKEFELLLKMLMSPGLIFTREELLNEIWPDEVVVVDRVIDVNVSRIRQKTGPYGHNIKTRSGYGYGFFPD